MSRARTILLLLMSLHAAGLAMLIPSDFGLPAVVLLLAAAAIVGTRGELQADVEEALGDDRKGARLVGWVFYVLLLVSFLAWIAAGGNLVAEGLEALILMQVVLMALPQLGQSRLLLLANAQALTFVAVLAGGIAPALAIGPHAALTIAWFALETARHRRLPVAWALRRALLPAFVAAALPAALLVPLQPKPYEPLNLVVAPSSVGTGAHDAYVRLFGYSALAIGAVLVALWLIPSESPVEEKKELATLRRRERVRVRPARPPESVVATGERGRVIRAYVDFLRQAARRGRVRAAGTTPAEFASSLPGRSADLATIFARARWSREPITKAHADDATAAVRSVLAALE